MSKRTKKERPYIRRVDKQRAPVTSGSSDIIKIRLVGVCKDNKVRQLTVKGINLDDGWVTEAFMKHLKRLRDEDS